MKLPYDTPLRYRGNDVSTKTFGLRIIHTPMQSDGGNTTWGGISVGVNAKIGTPVAHLRQTPHKAIPVLLR